MFIHRTTNGIVLLLIYVGYMIITDSNHVAIQHIKQQLQASFHMKDLGDLHCFLGLEVCFNSKRSFLYQHKYTKYLISLVGQTSVTPVVTPLEVNVKCHLDEGDQLSDSLL